MKKILMLIIALGMLSLSANEDKQIELRKTMISFATAMELIQHGILYNNKEEMHKGAQLLQVNNMKLFKKHGDALALYMPENPEFAKEFAKRTGQNIQDYANKMTEDLGSRKAYSKMSAIYTHILQECVGCHQKVRRW